MHIKYMHAYPPLHTPPMPHTPSCVPQSTPYLAASEMLLTGNCVIMCVVCLLHRRQLLAEQDSLFMVFYHNNKNLTKCTVNALNPRLVYKVSSKPSEKPCLEKPHKKRKKRKKLA